MGDFVKETDINYYEIWKRGEQTAAMKIAPCSDAPNAA